MRITTRKTISMITGQVLEHKWFDYEGVIALAKGDDTAKAAEQQQAAFNQNLMNIFNQQLGKQNALTDFMTSKLQPLIDNPSGYSPTDLTAMRTSATENVANQYANAQKALQSKLFTRGGDAAVLPNGVNDQLVGSLALNQASDTANAQNTITQNDEALKQQNFWNAINALNGQQTVLNPLGYAGAATSGAGAVAGLSNAVTSSQQSGWLNALAGGISGGITGIGTGLGTGLGKKI